MKDYANKQVVINRPSSFEVLMMKNHYGVSDYVVIAPSTSGDFVPMNIEQLRGFVKNSVDKYSARNVSIKNRENRIWRFIFGR